MASSQSFLSPQAYIATSSLDKRNPPTTPRKALKNVQPPNSVCELQFLRVVGRNEVRIIPPGEVKEADPHPDLVSRSGFAMQITEATWNGRVVAIKRIKHTFVINGDDESSEENSRTFRQFETSMEDMNYELQIMSKASLRDHRNIVKLLAVAFLPLPKNSADEKELILPSLVMELADTIFPDLSMFLDKEHNSFLPPEPTFKIVAGLLADVADGLAALHAHEIVHADLKPKNILIFPDESSPNGILAKLSDFGFSGMTTYNAWGKRAWHADGGRPRGGTAEWIAPECLGTEVIPVQEPRFYKEEDQDKAQIDLYSYGLLASYIGLWGLTPRCIIDNLDDAKLNDEVARIVSRKLEAYYLNSMENEELVGFLLDVVEKTLYLNPESRTINLKGVRTTLFGRHPYEIQFPPTQVFVLDFNLFPQSAQEFHRDGLYDAYWKSPVSVRKRVYQSFVNLTKGPFGQYVPQEVFACMKPEEVVEL